MRGFESRRALMLPGPTCEDVKEGIRAGVFSSQSTVIGIERDPATFERMRRNGARLPVVFAPVRTDLEDYIPPGEFDLFGLDFCGSMTASVADWIGRHHHALIPGGRLMLTALFGPRANHFLADRTERCLHGEWAAEYKEYVQHVPMHQRDPRTYVTEYTIHRLTKFRFASVQHYEYGDGRPMRVFVFQ
jgi:hypothetical protein